MPNFNLIKSDAHRWLQSVKSIPNIFTGPPDLAETKFDNLQDYEKFLYETAKLMLEKLDPHGFAFFQFTDRRRAGEWVDKSYHIMKAGRDTNTPLKWHKIIVFGDVGRVNIHRPTYQHYLCFSKKGKMSARTPDVMKSGLRAHKNAHTGEGLRHVFDFLDRRSSKKEIIDPFCGWGSALVEGLKRGYNVTGIDIDKDAIELCQRRLSMYCAGDDD